MNLREYMESDIVDFRLEDNIIKSHKNLFTEHIHGIRSYFNKNASYFINFKSKLVTMTNMFTENFKEIKAFMFIANHYGFQHEDKLLNFKDIGERDNIIQTFKFHVAMEMIFRGSTDKKDYDKIINSQEVIYESKRRFKKYNKLQNKNLNVIVRL